MNFQERVSYYLGKELYNIREKIIIHDNNKLIISNIKKEHYDNHLWNLYILPLINLITSCNKQNLYFLAEYGDIQNAVDKYKFVKIRSGNINKSIILKCMNQGRHWNNFYQIVDNTHYDNKIDKIFWRGTTTGSINRPGNRFLLVEKYFNKNDNFNIGFSSVCQNKSEYNKYVKDNVDIKTFLQYKYIISVEGNDKDSGLNWKLNSYSIILMPKPTKFSWLMEDKLIPDYHYILLKDDFSDLEEKLEWCRKNENKCKIIIYNANNYMKQFSDINNENAIEKEVINQYFDKINFI
jgi:hypothetical protein